jgi:hypothetical protein
MNSGIGSVVGFAMLGVATLVSGCMAEAQDQSDFERETELGSQAQAVLGPWQRVLTDNFSNSGSLGAWQVTSRADYNSSICNYVPGAVSFGTEDGRGVMRLTATKISATNYQSGHVKSNYSFKPAANEEYRVSASIKLIALNGSSYVGFASTYGAWPAFWTVQETSWPTKGEIDILEGYSYGGTTKFASNLFYGTTANQNQVGNSCESTWGNSEGWHMYDEYWKNVNGAVTVTIQLDGVTKATYTNARNSNLRLENFGPHNIIFNLAIGSNSNLGIFNNANINLYSKTMMWVDYVTVDKRTL